MKEIWKDINNYKGLYQVSNLGRIKRICPMEKIIKETDNGNGYKLVGLCKNNKRKNHYVHRLVAEAFIPNTKNLKEINHIDNNKANNVVENLEWCNRSYNIKYSYDNGYHIAPKNMLGRKGKKHPISIPVRQYDINGNFIKEYESANLASQETGICYVSIKKCRCKKTKNSRRIYMEI